MGNLSHRRLGRKEWLEQSLPSCVRVPCSELVKRGAQPAFLSWEGLWSSPGREVSHEELWDKLLQWHWEVWVSGAGDEVPFDGCEHTVFHIKVLHALGLLVWISVLGPGRFTDGAGYILLHKWGPVAFCGCQG